MVSEPNTVYSYIPPDQIVGAALPFVFENDASASFNFSSSIAIGIVAADNTVVGGTIPAYDASQYADASLPMQISGYNAGNYSDPAGGQGIQVEVVELGSNAQRAIVIAWYTYDNTGTPYWLFNGANFNVGDRSVTLPLGYFTGGGFAGSSGNSHPAEWGTITLDFPDCGHMVMNYQALSGLPSGVPVGTGTRTFTRTTSLNGLVCDSP